MSYKLSEVMSNMEESFIELDPTDVQDIINSVKIIEERFSENAEIRLNNDQILIEIMNLLYNDDVKPKDLSRKSDKFMKLILSDRESAIRHPKYLTPIINVIKTIILADLDEEIDESYEDEHNVKFRYQTDYLKRFVELTNNRTQSLSTIVPEIYKWTRMWKTPTNVMAHEPMVFKDSLNAFTKPHEDYVRLTGTSPFPHYFRGDECDVVGMLIEKASLQVVPKTYQFSIQEYFKQLREFKVGDSLIMCQNDFFEEFGGMGDRCNHTAKVTQVTSQVIIVNDTIHIPLNRYSPIFVFHKNEGNFFNKRDFKRHDRIEFLFDLNLPYNENVKFTYPINASEAIFMNVDQIKESCFTLRDIEKMCLKPYGYRIDDMDYLAFAKVKSILNNKHDKLLSSRDIEGHSAKRKKVTIMNAIKNWKEFCTNKKARLEKFTKGLDRIMNDISSKINAVQKEIKELREDNACDHTTYKGLVARKVSRMEELSDISDDLVFDKDRDPTNYKIKDDIMRENPRLDDVGLKAAIRKSLVDKNPRLTKTDLDFEVHAILKGKRRIRIGDYAILNIPHVSTSIVFKLSQVDGNPMWVRIMKAPFDTCDRFIKRQVEIGDDNGFDMNTCVHDTYDKLCHKLNHTRLNYQLDMLLNQQQTLQNVKSFITSEDIPKEVESYFEYVYKSPHVPRSLPILRMMTVGDDLNKYFGDIEYIDEDAMFGNADNFDGEFAVMIQERQKEKRKMDEHVSKASIILDGLCEVLGIELQQDIKDNILTCVLIDNPDISVDKDAFYALKFKSIKPDLYKSNIAYRKKVDEMIAQKYKEEVFKVAGQFYYNMYVHCASLIGLFIMAKYPSIMINSVIPSCTTVLSYSGFPLLSKGETVSIQSYMACLLKSISSPDDERLGRIYNTPVDIIRSNIEDKCESIIENRKDIGEAIEANRDNLGRVIKKLVVNKSGYEVLFPGFKPKHDVYKVGTVNDRRRIDDEIEFDIIRRSPLKDGMVVDKRKLGGLYVAPIKEDKKPQEIDTYFKEVVHKDVMVAKVYEYENIQEVQNALNLLNIDASNLKDDKWWDSIFFTQIDRDYEEITEFIGKHVSDMDGNLFIQLKRFLIDVSDNSESITNTLHRFMRGQLKQLLSKIVNAVVLEADGEEMKTVVLNFMGGDRIEGEDQRKSLRAMLRQQIIELGIIEDNILIYNPVMSSEDLIKNKMVMTRVFINILHKICGKDHATFDMFQRGVVQIGCDIANLIARKLYEFFLFNSTKQEEVRKKMEELRERRKTELMDAYKVNDEDRQLQMTLKVMGLPTWQDVGGDENSEKRILTFPAEEEENYRMNDILGENDDGDEDEDRYAQIRVD